MTGEKTPYEKHAEGLRYLANETRKQEIYPENPDGESLAKLEMLKELQDLGYDYQYFADIELRPAVKSREVMSVLLRYFPRMESYYTKETILTKIDAKAFPEIIQLAHELLMQYTPYERMEMTGLQRVIARGKTTPEHIELMYDLIKTPDGYASCPFIREKLCKCIPERMREFSYRYCDGILLIETLEDFYIYRDAESIGKLKEYAEITNERVAELKASKNYPLGVSQYEYYARFFERDNIRYDARHLLKKLLKKEET